MKLDPTRPFSDAETKVVFEAFVAYLASGDYEDRFVYYFELIRDKIRDGGLILGSDYRYIAIALRRFADATADLDKAHLATSALEVCDSVKP